MIGLLEEKRHIINVDESWLNELTFVRKMWQPINSKLTLSHKTIQPRLSVIAAIDTEGRIWYALT